MHISAKEGKGVLKRKTEIFMEIIADIIIRNVWL